MKPMEPDLTQLKPQKSSHWRCPIRVGLELFGDKWSLLIIRDMLFRNMCRYGELKNSINDISTNILASRLKQLESRDLIEKHKDPQDGKSFIYLPTEKGLALVPVLLSMARWGLAYGEDAGMPDQMVTMMAKGEDHLMASIADNIEARRVQLAG